MLAGQTSEYEGYQVALFPLDYINVTQRSSPSSYSHCCGNPTDFAGAHTIYPIYAPFDCTLYNAGAADRNGNRRMYVSDEEVWTLDGLHQCSVSFTHDDNPPTKTHFRQGELIGHTGTTPREMVTGDHVHMDQSLYPRMPLVSYGVYCQGLGNLCYAMQDDCPVEQVFYLTGDETIVNTMGIEFETWTGSPIYIKGKFKWWMACGKMRKRRNKL